jgi:hydrophobic/amphiphilic exporter-1 (mainly G- bacteria), HAE1 family
MTTMAALMETLLIALGFGSGAESRRPLGLAVVGGLVFSQILMLYITPIFYTYMESLQGFLGRTFPRRRACVAEPAIEHEPALEPLGRGEVNSLDSVPEYPKFQYRSAI